MRKWFIPLICLLPIIIPSIDCAKLSVSHKKSIGQPSKAAVKITRNKSGQTTVYFVRHAQTMALFTGHYSGKTEDEFSPRASQQLKILVSKLHNVPFDAAVVSPAWRTIHTALPVLKDHHLQATIWPELYECCDQHGLAARKIPPHSNFRYGKVIQVPSALQEFFKSDPRDNRRFAYGNYQDGMKQIKLEVNKIIKNFGGRGMTVLVVGHGYNGSRFVELMQGLSPDGKARLGTTGYVKLVENPTLANGHPSPKFSVEGSFHAYKLNQ